MLKVLRETIASKEDWKGAVKSLFQGNKKQLKKGMSFASFKLKEFKELGDEALDEKTEFSEYDLLTNNIYMICKGVID